MNIFFLILRINLFNWYKVYCIIDRGIFLIDFYGMMVREKIIFFLVLLFCLFIYKMFYIRFFLVCFIKGEIVFFSFL